MSGARFELHSMVISAALAGQGVALLPEFLVQAALDDGRLVKPVDLPLASAEAYYLVYPENRQASSRLRAFRNWVTGEAARFSAASSRVHPAMTAAQGVNTTLRQSSSRFSKIS